MGTALMAVGVLTLAVAFIAFSLYAAERAAVWFCNWLTRG